MKSKKKVFMTVLCAAALIVASVLGTMAFLTSKTDTVSNTFTVGNVAITLDETDVTPEGVKDTDTRVQGNEYKLIPGHTYIKDPTVHVDGNSEDSWLFVKVDNGISGIEAAGNTTIAKQMETKGWSVIDAENNVYAYNSKVTKGQNITVFDSFKIANDANVADKGSAKIDIIAYAVQADGFNTAAEAWAAAPANWNN